VVWTIALLALMIYVIAVYLTQMVLDYRMEQYATLGLERVDDEQYGALVKYFGSLLRSILTLYQAMSGGLSWDVAVGPLIVQITPLLGILFSFYVAFVMLAIMNVVTAVFVESALQSAKKDADVYIVHNVHDAFRQADIDMDKSVNAEEFQKLLQTSQLRETLCTIDIDEHGAMELFHMLDIDCTGTVFVRDIVDTCIKSHGMAKAIDLIVLMTEHRRQAHRWEEQIAQMSASIDALVTSSRGGLSPVSIKDGPRPWP